MSAALPAPALPAEIRMASGEGVPVPPPLAAAIDKSLALAIGARNPDDWRTAFATALIATLFDSGLFLVPKAHSRTREAVDANIYSLALSTKHAAERHLAAAARVMGDMPELGPLCRHYEQTVACLTGHAPPAGAERLLASLDERLRTLRQILLGVPLDAPAEIVTPAAASFVTPGDAE